MVTFWYEHLTLVKPLFIILKFCLNVTSEVSCSFCWKIFVTWNNCSKNCCFAAMILRNLIQFNLIPMFQSPLLGFIPKNVVFCDYLPGTNWFAFSLVCINLTLPVVFVSQLTTKRRRKNTKNILNIVYFDLFIFQKELLYERRKSWELVWSIIKYLLC